MFAKNKNSLSILAVGIIGMGILILLYPWISNCLAELQQENVIIGYEKSLLDMNDLQLEKEWKKAVEYNRNGENYETILNVDGNGVMGYIEIPKIKVKLPIYHSVKEEGLKKGVGHLEASKLPIGEKNSRPVLLGHRGLPGARLFTRLDELEQEDIFYIYVLDRMFAYRVSQIEIVLPEKVDDIKVIPEKDMITLVTCTPYGVNTHRLLITGERVLLPENQEEIEKQNVKNTKRNKIIIYSIIMFTGITIFMYPYYLNKSYKQKVKRQEKLYFRHVSSMEDRMEELYKDMRRKNQQLFHNRQENFRSEKDYQKKSLNLRKYGIYNNIVGYISIPVMKITLPIYLGASEENMKKGAVHLTETSYPIGGNNTNCVIAAHRGYSKAAMFRKIEKLKKGNKVYIKNFKEQLTYEVKEIKIILPTETEQILIQEGKDMVTLITCHPYRKNSHRYVVFCERM